MMKKIEGQNFQVIFSPEEKWTMFLWGRISPRRRGLSSLEEKWMKFP